MLFEWKKHSMKENCNKFKITKIMQGVFRLLNTLIGNEYNNTHTLSGKFRPI